MVTRLDIINRALQKLGRPRISAEGDLNLSATEAAFSYDILRRYELRRNTWRFSIRRATLYPVDTVIGASASVPITNVGPTMTVVFGNYSATITYPSGTIVLYNGFLYQSQVELNLGNQPDINYTQWTLYFGPRVAMPYDTTGSTDYGPGDLVYTPTAENYQLFMSVTGLNDVVLPSTIPAWSATTTWNKGDVAVQSAVNYESMFDLNLNNAPTANPAVWAVGTTYAATNQVLGTDYRIYSSVGNGNVGHNPVLDTAGTYWTYVSTPSWVELTKITGTQPNYSTNQAWLLLSDATLSRLIINYPAGTGPSSQEGTRNLFKLPANWLAEAPQDPKAGSFSALGGPSGIFYTDWQYEADFFCSWNTGPIYYRFAADITDTTQFDPLFIEGFSSRIAMELCDQLTNGDLKRQKKVNDEYKFFMGEARTKNAIEKGTEEPAEDDFIACRI